MGGALASGRREPPRPFEPADLPTGDLAHDHRTEPRPLPSETARRLSSDQADRPPRPEGPPARPDRRAASPQGPPSRATGEASTVGRVPRSGARDSSPNRRRADPYPLPPGEGARRAGEGLRLRGRNKLGVVTNKRGRLDLGRSVLGLQHDGGRWVLIDGDFVRRRGCFRLGVWDPHPPVGHPLPGGEGRDRLCAGWDRSRGRRIAELVPRSRLRRWLVRGGLGDSRLDARGVRGDPPVAEVGRPGRRRDVARSRTGGGGARSGGRGRGHQSGGLRARTGAEALAGRSPALLPSLLLLARFPPAFALLAEGLPARQAFRLRFGARPLGG